LLYTRAVQKATSSKVVTKKHWEKPYYI
jgi:hypothetical protein